MAAYWLVMTDGSTPRFLQGAFEFEGKGLDEPVPIDGTLRYVVPAGAVSQPVYFRGGNSCDEMVSVVIRHPLVRPVSTRYGASQAADLAAIRAVAAALFSPPGTPPTGWTPPT